ncbi:MAG: helix-turn-helix domain-containing protein [Azonexus sp.]|nr:helix-turn-helix domain-containing protein [Azonexus sp.]MDZ4315703.1 helix-turn-helix domain-containing protein [Azonexus sp.]
MGAIFAKTPKGHEEITVKAGGLTPRQRRVLIMIDGKRTVDELRDMLQTSDLQNTLGLLEDSGFIELLSIKDAQGVPQPVSDQPQASITAFRPASNPPNLKEMEMAKNFIMNSLKTFCGPFAHLHIVEAAYAAQTQENLREQFGPWYHAIVQTRAGQRRAEELRGQLLKVI